MVSRVAAEEAMKRLGSDVVLSSAPKIQQWIELSRDDVIEDPLLRLDILVSELSGIL